MVQAESIRPYLAHLKWLKKGICYSRFANGNVSHYVCMNRQMDQRCSMSPQSSTPWTNKLYAYNSTALWKDICLSFPRNNGNQNGLSFDCFQVGLWQHSNTKRVFGLGEDDGISSNSHRTRLETIAVLADWLVTIHLLLLTVAETTHSKQLHNYTVSQKKLGHFYFYCNFGKCWSIFKILSMSESERNGS